MLAKEDKMYRVATLSGFSNNVSFRRAFYKQFRINPSEFKMQIDQCDRTKGNGFCESCMFHSP